MTTEHSSRWEALLSGLNPDRSSREILFDPLIEDWAFAGLSEGYQEAIRQKKKAEEQRANLLDRLRWVVQKRLSGRDQEIMLLYLAGCTQVRIAELLGVSRSTVRRSLVEAGGRLKRIVEGTDLFRKGRSGEGVGVRILPLDSEEDYHEFIEFARTNSIQHIALGTFADLREVLVVYREDK